MSLTDYGAEYILTKVFENADIFEVALFTAGVPDDTPVLEEVEAQDYARLDIAGDVGGAIEYQAPDGSVSVIDTGIAAYKFLIDTSLSQMDWVFSGPLTSVNKSIIGYAILKPGVWSNPFPSSCVIDSKLFDIPFTPQIAGDKLVINQISFRLSKGIVS